MTTSLLTLETLTEKIQSSDAWVARAVYCISIELDSIDPTNRPESFKDDQLFFNSMKDFFTNNGYFTDRHIQISRRKLRTEYLEHLLVIANS